MRRSSCSLHASSSVENEAKNQTPAYLMRKAERDAGFEVSDAGSQAGVSLFDDDGHPRQTSHDGDSVTTDSEYTLG